MINSLFYFLYFAAFGIYIPYWTLYLHHLQLSPLQIAIVYSLRSVAFIFFPAVYGYLADRWQARKVFLIGTTFGQVLPLLLMIRYHTYAWLIVLTALFSIFNAAVLPFTEATTQEEQEEGKLDYGRTRIWGTLSFVLLAVGFGKLLDRVSEVWILYGFALFIAILALASSVMPAGKFRRVFRHENLREVLGRRNVWIFLACVLLMQASHGTFYGFFSIYLAQLGFKESGIGAQWAIAATSEMAVFFFASRILRRFPLRFLFSASLLIAALRWSLMWSTASYGWLMAIQSLHAFTFGVFHITSMRLIHKLFPEGFRSIGQSLYTASSAGFGSSAGLLLSGYLWQGLGHRTFLVSSCVAFAALLLSILLSRDERDYG